MINNICPITAEYYPSIPREQIVANCKTQISIKELSNLGGGFAVVATAVADAAMNASNTEGLYRCVFPEGVTGSLAMFKDQSGYLGTIMNENGIAGQARWVPAEGASVAMGIDPVTIAIGVALMSVNKKLDTIQKAQKEIIDFLNREKESKLKGAVNSLADIYESYSFNRDNENWKTSKLTVISTIKGDAESSMIFYRDSIIETLNNSKKLIHSNQATVKLQEELQHQFKCYGMALYIHSYATFLDVVLGENYKEDYLQNVSEKIKGNVYQYRVDYTEVYNQLSDYANSSAQKKLLEGVGAFGKLTGKAVAKVPIVSKGLLDEALIAAGEKIEDFSGKHVDNVMEQFMENKDAGVQLFLDNIENINQLCNQKVDILFDNEVIYLTA